MGGRRFLNEKSQVAWLGGGQRKRSQRNRQGKQNSVAAPINIRASKSKGGGSIFKKETHACNDFK